MNKRKQSETARNGRKWTLEEDEVLLHQLNLQKESVSGINWQAISKHLPRRNNKDCRKRWSKIGRKTNGGRWDDAEDDRLKCAVKIHGQSWTRVSDMVGTRNADQCSKHWKTCAEQGVIGSDTPSTNEPLLLIDVEAGGQKSEDVPEEHFSDDSITNLGSKHVHFLKNKRALEISETNNTDMSIDEAYGNSRSQYAVPPLDPSSNATEWPYNFDFDVGNFDMLDILEDPLGLDNFSTFCTPSEMSYPAHTPTGGATERYHDDLNNLASPFMHTNHQTITSQAQSQLDLPSMTNHESSFDYLGGQECGLWNRSTCGKDQISATAWNNPEPKSRSAIKTVIVLGDSNPDITTKLLDMIVRAEVRATITMTGDEDESNVRKETEAQFKSVEFCDQYVGS